MRGVSYAVDGDGSARGGARVPGGGGSPKEPQPGPAQAQHQKKKSLRLTPPPPRTFFKRAGSVFEPLKPFFMISSKGPSAKTLQWRANTGTRIENTFIINFICFLRVFVKGF